MTARQGTARSGWCIEGRHRWCRFDLCQCTECDCAKKGDRREAPRPA